MTLRTSPDIDPAHWLARFEAVGGSYMGSGETLAFCWATAGYTETDHLQARKLYHMLDDPTKWDSVAEHLAARMLQEVDQ